MIKKIIANTIIALVFTINTFAGIDVVVEPTLVNLLSMQQNGKVEKVQLVSSVATDRGKGAVCTYSFIDRETGAKVFVTFTFRDSDVGIVGWTNTSDVAISVTDSGQEAVSTVDPSLAERELYRGGPVVISRTPDGDGNIIYAVYTAKRVGPTPEETQESHVDTDIFQLSE